MSDLVGSSQKLQALAADGIIQLDGNIVRLADASPFPVRTAASAFDAYLTSGWRTYNRAV